MLLLFHSLLAPTGQPELPPQPEPTVQGGGGGLALRNKPARTPVQSAPWQWVPFLPVAPKRPRKKRQAEVLFLGG